MIDYIIKTEHLTVQSGRRYLLKDINWEVEKNQHWVIFGLNGSGKTTLLSIIAGYKLPTSGEAWVLGSAYDNTNVVNIRKKIGWVSNSFFDQHYSSESALDIVLSGLFGTLGLTFDIKDDNIIRAKELLKALGLERKMYRPYNMMSKGERQNVLIARALIANPELLLLDEPGTGLDVMARETMKATIQEIALNHNSTIIYVTHYVDEILDVFSHCMLIKNGRCFMQGPCSNIISSEIFSNFLGHNVQISRCNEQLHFTTSMSPI